MDNKYALVVERMEELNKSQGGVQNRFKDKVNFVLAMDPDTNRRIAYHRAPEYLHFWSQADLEELKEVNVLLHDGDTVDIKIGRDKPVKAIAFDLDQLKLEFDKEELDTNVAYRAANTQRSLERQLKVAKGTGAADRAMAALLQSVKENFEPSALSKLLSAKKAPVVNIKKSGPSTLAGVPLLFLSDLHWGETVDPKQIEGLNEFNLSIATKRLDRVVEKSSELWFNHMAGQYYDGLVLALGGDLLSGNIHEELRQTNDDTILECVLDLSNKLAAHILYLSRQFKRIYIPCVVGNHGRLDRKPTAKNAVKDNFDWQVYRITRELVDTALKGTQYEGVVTFDIAESLDLNFSIYGTNYLLTHGDQIGGGSGVGGFWPSMMRTAYRKQERLAAANQPGFHYMMCGHFHKYGNVSNVIVNGSLKGYDEWVYKMNFGYEEPKQAMWITHPALGITQHHPIFGETPDPDKQRAFNALISAKGRSVVLA